MGTLSIIELDFQHRTTRGPWYVVSEWDTWESDSGERWIGFVNPYDPFNGYISLREQDTIWLSNQYPFEYELVEIDWQTGDLVRFWNVSHYCLLGDYWKFKTWDRGKWRKVKLPASNVIWRGPLENPVASERDYSLSDAVLKSAAFSMMNMTGGRGSGAELMRFALRIPFLR